MVGEISRERMRTDLFYLAKHPLPCRCAKFTLPGHSRDTLREADDYIARQLEACGYLVKRESVKVKAFRRDPLKPVAQQYAPPQPDDPWFTACNVYAEKKGKANGNGIILVLAHKDSQSWIQSPGANDNAIGTAGVLELARQITGYQPNLTIRFLFCNEEHTPWTSITAAAKAKERNDQLVAVINIDGIGVKSSEATSAGKKTNVTAFTKAEGEPLANLITAVNEKFEIGLQQQVLRRPSPADDDGSFVNAGFPVTIVNSGSWPYGDPNYHTMDDIPERTDVDNAAMAIQAIAAAVLTLDRNWKS